MIVAPSKVVPIRPAIVRPVPPPPVRRATHAESLLDACFQVRTAAIAVAIRAARKAAEA
jgi:hypothetical protein